MTFEGSGNWGDSDDECQGTEDAVYEQVKQQDRGYVACSMPGCDRVLHGVYPGQFESQFMKAVADCTEVQEKAGLPRLYFCRSFSDALAEKDLIRERLVEKQAGCQPNSQVFMRCQARIARLDMTKEQEKVFRRNLLVEQSVFRADWEAFRNVQGRIERLDMSKDRDKLTCTKLLEDQKAFADGNRAYLLYEARLAQLGDFLPSPRVGCYEKFKDLERRIACHGPNEQWDKSEIEYFGSDVLDHAYVAYHSHRRMVEKKLLTDARQRRAMH